MRQLWVILSVLAGCTGPKEAAAPDPAPPPEPPVLQEAVVEEAPTDPAPVVRPEIGIPGGGPPSKSARTRNAEGLERHKEDKFDEAAELFSRALEADPSYTMARYNLACAHARRGKLDAAWSELKTVMARDPARILTRMEHDPDLTELRGSGYWGEMTAFAKQVEAEVKFAIEHGAAVVLSRESRGEGPPALLRAGVYVHEWGRFVALAPRVKGARGALVSLDKRLVAVATYGVDCMSHNCALLDARVRVFRPLQADPFAEESAVPRVAGLEVRFDAIGSAVRWHDCNFVDCLTPWVRPSPKETPKDKSHNDPGGIAQTYAGTQWRPAPGGRVRRGALRVSGHDPIKLGSRHRLRNEYGRIGPSQVVVDASNACAAVLTTGVDCLDHPMFKHAASIVDLASSTVHKLPTPNRKYAASVTIGEDGALYLQSGTELWRWKDCTSALTDDPETLPTGVTLFVPRRDHPDCELAG